MSSGSKRTSDEVDFDVGHGPGGKQGEENMAPKTKDGSLLRNGTFESEGEGVEYGLNDYERINPNDAEKEYNYEEDELTGNAVERPEPYVDQAETVRSTKGKTFRLE